MAKSSIHIEKGGAHFLPHNARENYSKSVVFFDEENLISKSTKEAFEIYRDELKKRSEAYTKRTKQKLQKNTVTHLSAIVNLNQETSEQDFMKLLQKIEDDLGTKIFQYAIHRDEGHIVHKKTGVKLASGIDFFANPEDKKLYADSKFEKPLKIEDFEVVKNYHAHIEFMGLDEEGRSVTKKLTKTYLRNLQDDTAKILKMERGMNSKKKRLSTHEFKQSKANETRKDFDNYVTQKELQKEIAEMRSKLKEQGAQRADYAKLEAENKKLKELVKRKELTIKELEKTKKSWSFFGVPNHTHDATKSELEKHKASDQKKSKIIKERDQKLKEREMQIKERDQKLKERDQKIAEFDEVIHYLKIKKNEPLVPQIKVRDLFENPKIGELEKKLETIEDDLKFEFEGEIIGMRARLKEQEQHIQQQEQIIRSLTMQISEFRDKFLTIANRANSATREAFAGIGEIAQRIFKKDFAPSDDQNNIRRGL